MFVLAKENGTSASELGRQLGISRQLAARLAKQAETAG
jgi:biotin operon repressor